MIYKKYNKYNIPFIFLKYSNTSYILTYSSFYKSWYQPLVIKVIGYPYDINPITSYALRPSSTYK